MTKKLFSILVLISMALHYCGKLGVISYLYSNRFELAYSLGLVAEKQISICKSDHFQQAQLNLLPEKERQLPSEEAPESGLFCPPQVVDLPAPVQSSVKSLTRFISRDYASPGSDIFHPPGLLS